jgi:hypothetical protein
MLSDWHVEDLTFKELGVAKHVVRQTCLTGTIDKMTPSIIRMGDYMGWEFRDGMDRQDGEECINDIVMNHNPEETYISHESEEWDRFYANNRYDCELYEIAQSTWRAQIQTAIPYSLQL